MSRIRKRKILKMLSSFIIYFIESSSLTIIIEEKYFKLCVFCCSIRKSSVYKFRKSCVPRGGNCDHRPKYCCNGGSCRCNLWGVNCKCQRMGFFQKWGK